MLRSVNHTTDTACEEPLPNPLTTVEVLDELEDRIRAQADLQVVGSWAWRAHMADVIHVIDVRKIVAQVIS